MPLRSLLCLLGLALTLARSAPLGAAGPDWLGEMPSAETVMAKITGADPFDTAARQHAAFERLSAILRDMVGSRAFRNEVTAAEKALSQSYGHQATAVAAALIESLPPAERTGAGSRRARWFALTRQYEFDPAFQRTLAETFFSPAFRAQLDQAGKSAAASAKAGRELLQQPPPHPAEPAGTRDQIRALVPAKWQWALDMRLWLGMAVLLFAFGLYRGAAPFGLAPADPFELRAGARRYTLNRTVGTVTDVQRWSEATTIPTSQTITHHDGSQTTVHSSTTRVTNRIQLMLRDDAGHTNDIQLANIDLAIAVGQGLGAVWATPRGAKWGSYVLLHNYDLGRTQFMPAIAVTVKMPVWPALPLGVALFCAGAGWMVALAGLIGYGVIAAIVSHLRERRFKSALAPALLAAMPRPAETIVLPGGGMLSPG